MQKVKLRPEKKKKLPAPARLFHPPPCQALTTVTLMAYDANLRLLFRRVSSAGRTNQNLGTSSQRGSHSEISMQRPVTVPSFNRRVG